MKITHSLVALAALLLPALSASAAKFPYPDEENPWFTVDIPATWKPALSDDQSLEATSPDEAAYLAFWVLKDKKAIDNLDKEIDELLKDNIKNPKLTSDEPTKKTINGIEFTMFAGKGKAEEDDKPVGFEIFLFSPKPGKLGIFFCQYNADAPKSVIAGLIKIVESIQKAKKAE